MKKIIRLFSAQVAMMLLAANVTLTSCEGTLDDVFGEWDRPSGHASSGSSTVAVTSVELSETLINASVGASSVSLTATVNPTDATDKTVKWKSSNSSVATVDDNGMVNFVGKGIATITATATNGTDDITDDFEATCEVTVNESTVNLATTSTDITVTDGQVLTGTLANSVKITIADGATVTLYGVDINGSATWTSGGCAGLTCEGDATIVLADGSTNIVKGFHKYYPGIYVAPGNTLTIRGGSIGNGILNASCCGTGSNTAAGIGAGCYASRSCGNIVIEGGDITATADAAAGIGSAYNSNCGNITIKGGTVHASSTSYYPGIGSGNSASCGNITISGGNVTATSTGAAGIGCGYYNSTCGDITISGGTVNATGGSGAAGAAAGIGGAYTNDENLSNCGNILITGGTVTAMGGTNAGVAGGAGIGTGTRCKSGTITIQGGSITATGGANAAGIGAGKGGVCGSITITDGVTFVDANKGTSGLYDIGIATDISETYKSAIKDGDTPGSVTIAASVSTSDNNKHYTDGTATNGYNKQ